MIRKCSCGKILGNKPGSGKTTGICKECLFKKYPKKMAEEIIRKTEKATGEKVE